jgi:hypothetical protein
MCRNRPRVFNNLALENGANLSRDTYRESRTMPIKTFECLKHIVFGEAWAFDRVETGLGPAIVVFLTEADRVAVLLEAPEYWLTPSEPVANQADVAKAYRTWRIANGHNVVQKTDAVQAEFSRSEIAGAAGVATSQQAQATAELP